MSSLGRSVGFPCDDCYKHEDSFLVPFDGQPTTTPGHMLVLHSIASDTPLLLVLIGMDWILPLASLLLRIRSCRGPMMLGQHSFVFSYSEELFAQTVLMELPESLLGYMRKKSTLVALTLSSFVAAKQEPLVQITKSQDIGLHQSELFSSYMEVYAKI